MKSVIAATIAGFLVGGVSLAFGEDASTAAPETKHAVSFRVGVYNEDQTYQDWEAKYSAPFVGVQLDAGVPLGTGPLSINYLGAFDLAYGTYDEEESEGLKFNQSLARLKLQAALALALPLDRLVISPFAGIGFRYWYRGEGDGVAPYIESWQAVYGVLGVRAEIKSFFAQVDVQSPFSEKISTGSTLGFDYDFQEEDKTTMVTAEIGVTSEAGSVSLFVESFTYTKDSPNPQPTLGLGLGEDITSTTVGGRFAKKF